MCPLTPGSDDRLQTWPNGEGRIRLSEDDGPPAHEFLEDDYDEDNEGLADDEPLAVRAERLRAGSTKTLPPASTTTEPGDLEDETSGVIDLPQDSEHNTT